MKYRWGFLDENDIFAECQPKVDDSTAIDFSQESNEMFYRGKINGSLAFRFEFDDILSKGFNYEHIVVLQWYDADNDEWKEVWKGRFALTDCEIDYDTKTITVQPATLDRYTAIMDNLEKEYNIVKLAPAMKPVEILIRPCLQVYLCGSDKLSCFVGDNYWETTCDALTSWEDIEGNGLEHEDFAFAALIKWKGGDLAGQSIVYSVTNGNTTGYMTGWAFSGGDRYQVTIRYEFERATGHNGGTFKYYLENTLLFTAYIEEPGELPEITINDTANVDDATAEMLDLRSRTLAQTDYPNGMHTIDGVNLIINDISSDDFAGTNANYNKRIRCYTADLIVSADVVEEPTVWGQNINGKYFVKPSDTPTDHYMPVGQSKWRLVSCWWKPYRDNGVRVIDVLTQNFTTSRTIADAYDYRQTIFRLLNKAGINPTYIISGCLGGSNDYVGTRTDLVITPRSNVISSYYNTPAQNAPISLAKIFTMLKQVFKAYWYIDENGSLHIEHVSYFDNGLNYTDSPQLLIDLESELHTNTKSNKVFGQNKVKFDKQEMPEQFSFSWADVQTRPFIGYPINCLDAYIQKGQKEENAIGDFDSDVDFVLSSPNDVSKEGFFLFALPPISGGGYSSTLKVEKVSITDEVGDTYNVEIQNGDAAFVKIHEKWWRYSLPCENVNINNEDTTAITTGRFKVQSVEFADVIMADILKDIDNCNKVIRTQQGDGHIKTISINLNSLVAKGDLLFNFIGRWYYLKGTAIGSSITIFVNGESTTIEVTDNKFTYRYKEPISTLTFNAADVVSVNFADCDKLDNLTSCDALFDGCEELIAVDFGGKTFGAVTTANNMFRGCVALTTLICPDSSTWKADLDLSDCPDFTLESFYDLIKFLYFYESGVHTITPNSTMWNALDGDTQTDLIAKATERGWTINMPAAYSITGQSAANTVYATINGSPVEIPVTAGQWQYDYNAAITSISFENDADVTDIDFSLSDGLAGVTELNDAFKNCAGLTTVDFTNCDLSNVASASDAFAGCIALYELIIPAGTWKPDVDLSDTVIMYAEMSNVVSGLYTYTSGTHTITFNSTIWDALSVAQQQTIFDAAQLKWWITNAVAVVYYIRGTSSNVNGQETFTMAFINDNSLTPSARETVTCNVDGNGNWEFSYQHKKLYDTRYFANNKTTLLTIDFTDADDFSRLIYLSQESQGMFKGCSNLTSVNFGNRTFENVVDASVLFRECTSLTTCDLSHAIFTSLTDAHFMFDTCSLQNIDLSSATFANVTTARGMFQYSSALNGTIDLSSATFASVTTTYEMFLYCKASTIDMRNATFGANTTAYHMFYRAENVVTLRFDKANFTSSSNIQGLFRYMNAMTTFVCAVSNCNVNPSASGAANLMNLGESPLTYQSMLNFANWLSDKTGYSASTITFKATYWNALSTDEKNTLDGIISGKNWTRAIA